MSTTDAVLKPDQVPNFITDYYSHLWKEKPTIVAEKLGTASKQGSGRSFKVRSIPTISDGIKAGLTPKFENPIEATMAYSQNMSRYVATHDMLNEMKGQGYVKWYSPGSKNIPKGWVPLDGIMTKKVAPVSVGTAKASIPKGSNTGQPLATGRPRMRPACSTISSARAWRKATARRSTKRRGPQRTA